MNDILTTSSLARRKQYKKIEIIQQIEGNNLTNFSCIVFFKRLLGNELALLALLVAHSFVI